MQISVYKILRDIAFAKQKMDRGHLSSEQRLISGIKLEINLKKIVVEITNRLMENPTIRQLFENNINFVSNYQN